jgi:hypothetical protein
MAVGQVSFESPRFEVGGNCQMMKPVAADVSPLHLNMK